MESILDFCSLWFEDFNFENLPKLNIKDCDLETFSQIKRHCVTWNMFQKFVPFFLSTRLEYGFQLKIIFENIGISIGLIDNLCNAISKYSNIIYFYNSKLEKSDVCAHTIICSNVFYVIRDGCVKKYKCNIVHFRIGLCLENIKYINMMSKKNKMMEKKQRLKLKLLLRSKLKHGSFFQPRRLVNKTVLKSQEIFHVHHVDVENQSFLARNKKKKMFSFSVNNVCCTEWTTNDKTYGSGRKIIYTIDLNSNFYRKQKFAFIQGLYRPCLIQKILAKGDVVNIFKHIFSFLNKIQK